MALTTLTETYSTFISKKSYDSSNDQDIMKVIVSWLYETNNQRRQELAYLVMLCNNPNINEVARNLGINFVFTQKV